MLPSCKGVEYISCILPMFTRQEMIAARFCNELPMGSYTRETTMRYIKKVSAVSCPFASNTPPAKAVVTMPNLSNS